MSLLKKCLTAFNPYAVRSTLAEAEYAARLGSVALMGTAIQSFVSTAFQRSDPEDIKALMMRAEGPVSLEGAIVSDRLYSQIMPLLTTVLWAVTVLTIIVCGVLAWVQWRKLTKLIPLLYLIVFGLGFMSMISTLMDPNMRVLAQDGASVMQGGVAVVLAVLMFTAYRGANQYHALLGDQT